MHLGARCQRHDSRRIISPRVALNSLRVSRVIARRSTWRNLSPRKRGRGAPTDAGTGEAEERRFVRASPPRLFSSSVPKVRVPPCRGIPYGRYGALETVPFPVQRPSTETVLCSNRSGIGEGKRESAALFLLCRGYTRSAGGVLARTTEHYTRSRRN